ncbi:MAG: 2-keto-4-pentenoate hydratase/2-oxohepta-3-ene-1,7-dioic acid hydratase in catechol pathway [Porticoccaceae bacterium]|jgi:2-keto-4-pentenoate hydratase/2-oxohepta-3-ene-1,7-dioic acid hydratase in catechol pathway
MLADGVRFADLNSCHEMMTGKPSGDFRSMLDLMRGGPAALESARATLAYAEANSELPGVRQLLDVCLLAPLPQPVKIRSFSVYEKHMLQSLDAVINAKVGSWAVKLNHVLKLIKPPKQFYTAPAYYKGSNTTVIGHEADIRWPTFDEEKMDYELEMGVFIGREGQDIAASDAKPYIFGYTVYNDVSARDRLLKELFKGKLGPLKGKDFETGNAMGPWIITADEVADPYNLAMEVRVNGEVRGRGNSGEMHYSIEEMIAFASMGERLVPGEFFGTGAVGNGTGIESWSFLNPGDVIELEIEGIGLLRNRLIANE